MLAVCIVLRQPSAASKICKENNSNYLICCVSCYKESQRDAHLTHVFVGMSASSLFNKHWFSVHVMVDSSMLTPMKTSLCFGLLDSMSLSPTGCFH